MVTSTYASGVSEGKMRVSNKELDDLEAKIEGHLPRLTDRDGREFFRLELTGRERNLLAEALRKWYPVTD